MAIATSGSTFGQRVQGFLEVFAHFNLRMIMALSNFPEDCGW